MPAPAFTEVGAGVYVLRYPTLDVNVSLILGGEVAVVVDTLSSAEQASELVEAVREVTRLPLVVVNTHHHYDHCLGNATVAQASPGAPIWAHESTLVTLRDDGALLQRAWAEELEPTEPELAQAVATATLLPPDRGVHTESIMDVGGRIVELRHYGRGHTEGDLVVVVPDSAVVIAGDLVEESGPPSFVDSYPLDWPSTVFAMSQVPWPTATVVPGHGAVVGLDFVRHQHAELTELEWLIRTGHGDGAAPETVAKQAPFGASSLVAVRRGYAELAGRL